MTGGTLPAMTFKRVMDYAHQGITLRPIPGIENPLPSEKDAARTAAAKPKDGGLPQLVRPRMLSVQSTKILKDLGEKLKEAAPLSMQKVASAK
jgi:penicillin-binding protein 1A